MSLIIHSNRIYCIQTVCILKITKVPLFYSDLRTLEIKCLSNASLNDLSDSLCI